MQFNLLGGKYVLKKSDKRGGRGCFNKKGESDKNPKINKQGNAYLALESTSTFIGTIILTGDTKHSKAISRIIKKH